MFDNIFAQRGVGLDEALDDFVEVKGGEVEHIQYPGETNVCRSWVTTAMVVSSSLKTALWAWGANDINTTRHKSSRHLNIDVIVHKGKTQHKEIVCNGVSYLFGSNLRDPPPYAAMTTSRAQAKSDVWNVESLRSLLEWKSKDSAQGK